MRAVELPLKSEVNALKMCRYRTMKKLPALVVVILALMMQVRVAYACEMAGLWPTEHCSAHGLIAETGDRAPQDRGSDCDIGLDLAGRNLRQSGYLDDGLDDLASQLTEPQPVLVPAAWPPPRVRLPPRHRPPIPRAAPPAAALAGSITYLVTSRLRI